ncbi:MAG: glycosyltransferase [Treponema sp.]|nr:glycosyltransferase [Treponema sp.]
MKTAIVHYWLVNMRGGEKVLQALLEMFPDADIYTHVYNPAAMPVGIKSRRVFTSYIQKLPLAKKLYQLYMPLMPNALNGFNLQDYDLVISSESGPAKGVVPNPNAFHVCYCHSPMRYLWDMYHEYMGKTNPVVRFFMKRLIPGLRLWDVASSNLVDRFIANSGYVAKRIRRYYNREAEVIYPPVDIEKFLAVKRKPDDFYLFFGQLAGYKRADLAIEACIKSGRKLVVAGSGAKKAEIKKYTESGLVEFKGHVSDDELLELYAAARALIFPGIEDFGIVPVEAQAAGCPVIAYRDGGALETVRENATGIFFDEQNAASLCDAIVRFENAASGGAFADRKVFNDHVGQFSAQAFREKMEKIIKERKRV